MPDLRNQILGPNTGPYPVAKTALTDAISAGWKKLTHPAANVAPGVGGLLGGPVKATAGLQDMASGLLQILTSPLASAAAEFFPLLQQAGQIPVGPKIGNESANLGQVAQAVTSLPGQVTKALGHGLGYPAEQSQEIGDTVGFPYGKLAALAKVGAPIGASFVALHQIPKDIWRDRTDVQGKYREFLDRSHYNEDAENIFKHTGMFTHPVDGDIRLEVPDNEMKLLHPLTQIQQLAKAIHEGKDTEPLLSEVVRHDKLFGLLPQVGDFRMGFRSGRGAAFTSEPPTLISPEDHIRNGWRPKPGQMTMGIGSLRDPNKLVSGGEFMSDIVHETGHGIDSFNPMAAGGANEDIAGGFLPYYMDSGENTVRLAANRKDLTPAQLRQYYPFDEHRAESNFRFLERNPDTAPYYPQHPYYSEIPKDKATVHFRADLQNVKDWTKFYDEYNRLKGRNK